MKIKQIRNATLKIEYAGKIFLIDPWLIDKGKFGSFSDILGKPFHVPDPLKEQIPMPIFDLPEPVEQILEGVDYYLITHIHPDHIDMDFKTNTIGEPLNKNVPIIAQDESDAEIIKQSKFNDVIVLGNQSLEIDEIKITKTPALHGKINPMCDACGIIFQSANEKTLYIAGDTIWFEGVRDTIKRFSPDIIILNACAAEFIGYGRLIMNDEDVDCVAQTSPNAQIILSHMDNVPHASITRQSMRGLMASRGIKYLMPDDGEILEF